MKRTALVYGIAIAGDALAHQLVNRGWRVLIADDLILNDKATDKKRAMAQAVGATLVEKPDAAVVQKLVEQSEMVCPSPGVPETHAVVAAAVAAGVPIRTEIDLAYEWEQQRAQGPRPILAITGTDGKTTVTMLVAHILATAGHRPAAVGNTEVPFAAALSDATPNGNVDVFAVECSSFRLNWLDSFRAEAAVWLNMAPDHQNWHSSIAAYEAAKARIWEHRRATDVAIGFADDPIVMRNLRAAGGITRTFSTRDADYFVADNHLVGPDGVIAAVSSMTRDLPHDLTNALAAAALVLESGLAESSDVAAALATFRHPPHRIEPVAEIDGVRWFNDSKATSPHAALTAIRSFDRVVLLAGGLNKGLDLSSLATEKDHIKAVIGLGSSAADITHAFDGIRPTSVAHSMKEAVSMADDLAVAGDVVLLSPACASFDWYPSGGYPARGDDFRHLVEELAVRPKEVRNG